MNLNVSLGSAGASPSQSVAPHHLGSAGASPSQSVAPHHLGSAGASPSLAIAILAALAWHVITFRLAPRLKLVKPNFNNKPIMASYGIVAFAYVAAIAVGLGAFGYARWADLKLYLGVMGAMWALGAIDDVFGSRDATGFKGHFKKLLFERKLTTGAAKAIGGGIVGIAAGWHISGGDPVRWILAALVIPLAANVLNLLDIRPGRAVAVFFCGLGVTWVMVGGKLSVGWFEAAVAAVALVWAIPDARGRAMMGDSWSNALGAVLGLSIAIGTGVCAQAAAIALLVAIHVYSEKHSINDLIGRNRVLRAIDGRLGVR